MNGKTVGLPIPPIILIWIIASIIIIVALRLTKWGRNLTLLEEVVYHQQDYLFLKEGIGLELM